MKWIVNLSGGLGSMWALKQAIELKGIENVEAWFADTKIEDPDLYRFLDDIEKFFGITIQRFVEGRDVWQVINDEGYITLFAGPNRIAPCSKILKREVLDKEFDRRFQPDEATLVSGLGWQEPHRIEALREAKKPHLTWFPCAEAPYMDTCSITNWLEERGIEIPQLYKLSFDHNNCGGFCVKAGQAHFANLWHKLPERYLHHEAKEEEFRERIGKDVAILRDRRGGTSTPMTLRQFRERLETGDTDYERDDWGGCGCFAPVTQGRMGDLLMETEVYVKPKRVKKAKA